MPNPPRTADELRASWDAFWAARDHLIIPSASVIPVDKSVLFTVAGMVPFKDYFLGNEAPPHRRAASIQKCIRAGGKHNDLDDIGRTNRHFSFFEMMGNFSFGDYFKADAIPWAWEFTTEHLGFDPGQLWVTVHLSDDEADEIWRDSVGVRPERIQRLDDDNYWKMGDTGPCGPCSEIFIDLGPEHGDDGGPATGNDRFIEFWNLVFMQYDQRSGGADSEGEKVPLPKPSIDTGAGLERMLFLLQRKNSIWEIDLFEPLIDRAQEVCDTIYGRNPEHDVYLRILAEHARSMAIMVGDGVMPSNTERGYVLRRIIRRAVRHAWLLGAHDLVTPRMIEAVVSVMGNAYPKLLADRDLITRILAREEESFRRTLQRGTEYLDEILDDGDVTGDAAFFLHDTLGFPVDLTREIAAERERNVDLDAFDTRMAEQRDRAREAAKEAGGQANAPVELYREVLDEHGTTEFTGRTESSTAATVLAIARGADRVVRADEGDTVELLLDRTPFYAESGGQVGDTGAISGEDFTLEVLDTQVGLPGLHVHRVRVANGNLVEGAGVNASIDVDRRNRIRRNHTATHILHWALREVLGAHVKQAGSHVGPDRLRFDFSHFEAVTPEELARIEQLANAQVIADAPVTHTEMSKSEAEAAGAVAFFGDKYGERVRVLGAGPSLELCGGTHVDALGFIGPIKILSESSIGSNVRRIEALTGEGALAYIADTEAQLRRVGSALKAAPAEIDDKIAKLLAQVKSLEGDVASMRAQQAQQSARELVADAHNGAVIARRDGLAPDDLRQLAQSTLALVGSGVVAIVGVGPDGSKAGVAVAVSKDRVAAGASAADIGAPAARALGGGTAKNAELVVGGGPKIDQIDAALAALRHGIAAAS
jgi:alanyl-tRNA synthetase